MRLHGATRTCFITSADGAAGPMAADGSWDPRSACVRPEEPPSRAGDEPGSECTAKATLPPPVDQAMNFPARVALGWATTEPGTGRLGCCLHPRPGTL